MRGRRALTALFIAAACAVMLPRLAGVGMFVDGITYATIARNLAQAPRFEPWQLHYTDTLHAAFFEHPPLGIWLEAATFKATGDVPWAERLHALGVTAAFFAALAALWRAARPDPSVGAWLPLTLMLALPLTSWDLSNGMLEAPLTAACMAAAVATLRGWDSRTGQRALAWGCVAGSMLLAALLIKGPTALFVLALPGFSRWLRPQAARRLRAWVAFGTLAALALGAALLLAQPDARHYLAQYAEQQLWSSLRGRRELASSRFVALARGLSELPVALALAMGCHFLARRLGGTAAVSQRSVGPGAPALGWLGVGLSASLPLVLSPKQSGWYVFQSLPFFVLALACWTAPAAAWLQGLADRVALRLGWGAGLLVLGSCVVATWRFDHIDKHQDFHAAFTRQPLAALTGERLGVCPPELMRNWSLHANVARQLRASLTEGRSPWLLIDHATACVPPSNCVSAHPPQPARYELLRCAL